VILSGGSGTRLWPLSTPEIPKQFAPLFGDRSLFAMTMDRLVGLSGLRGAIVVTGAAHRDLVRRETASASIETSSILVEPIGRNTAPASLAAALVAGPRDVLVILPSDHLISDVAAFESAVTTAADIASEGGIVAFGIAPSRPETGFGYIEMGEERGTVFAIERFKEKPDDAAAGAMVADGRHLWNSGMFVVRADHLLEEAGRHCRALLDGVASSLPPRRSGVIDLGPEFAALEAVSIDNAIMEKTDRGLVLPIDVGWDDVGSYRSLLDASELDPNGNHVSGDVTLSDVVGSFVKSTSRRVVVSGLADVVVVETPEAVLVVPLDRAQEVRELQRRPDQS